MSRGSSTTTVALYYSADATPVTESLNRIAAAATTTGQKVSDEVGGGGERAQSRVRASFEVIDRAFATTGANLGPVSEAFERLGITLDGIEEKGSRLSRIGQGVGFGAAGLGALALSFNQKDAAAAAGLQDAYDNTGKSVDDFSGKVESADGQMAKFGHTSADARNALAILTRASNDPQVALNDLGLVANLAAVNLGKGRDGSLTTAAQDLGAALDGSAKSLRGYGVDITGLKDTAKETADATKAVASATAANTAAQANLADVQQRIAAAVAAAEEAAASRVEAAKARQVNADDALTTAEQANAQRVTDARSTVATAEQTLGDDRATVAEAVAARVAAADQKVTDAHTALETATANLSDLEARLAASHALTATDADSLASAQLRLKNVQADHAAGLLTGISYTQQLAQANLDLKSVQDSQADKQQLSVSDQQDLAKANADVTTKTQDLTQAQSDAATAGQETRQEQDELRNATQGVSRATLELSRALKAASPDSAGMAKLLREQKAAHDGVTKAEQDQAAASRDTVTESQELTKAQDEATAAADRLKTAQQQLQGAQDDSVANGTKLQAAIDQLTAKTAGAARAQASTLTGQLKGDLAEVENFIAGATPKIDEALVGVGSALGILSNVSDLHLNRKNKGSLGSSILDAANAADSLRTSIATNESDIGTSLGGVATSADKNLGKNSKFTVAMGAAGVAASGLAGYLAGSSGNTGETIAGGLSAIIGGAASGAAFGPEGAVAGGLLGAASTLLGKFESNAKAAKDQAIGYAQALDADSGALGRNVQAMALQQLTQSLGAAGLAKLTASGISEGTLLGDVVNGQVNTKAANQQLVAAGFGAGSSQYDSVMGVLQALAAGVQLQTAVNNFKNGTGTVMGSALGNLGTGPGTVLGSIAQLPHHATGGYATGRFVAGETAPEIIDVGSTTAYVHNGDETASMLAGGGDLHLHMNFHGPVVGRAGVQELTDMVIVGLNRHVNSGGTIFSARNARKFGARLG